MENTQPVHSNKEPIRLFKSDFLEFFTHIHPAAVLAIFLPLVIGFAVSGMRNTSTGALPYLPVFWVLGLLIWTPTEYLLHRFLFHFSPRGKTQKRISFLFHGIHHAQPMVKTRLVMPPIVSLPLAALFYGLFHLLLRVTGFGPGLSDMLFSGFLAGYLSYDMLHYSMHHFNIKSGYLQKIRRNHMRHHALTPNKRFGVTTLFWDRVFGTYVEEDL
jgi:sterol desaturase/sphingolipid hydroxylase (fatty acid hydroxylase superfamily)